jgi:hypothetical protein
MSFRSDLMARVFPLLLVLVNLTAAAFPLRAESPLYPPLEARRASPGNTTYHIDPRNGDDADSGLGREEAWRTFHPVNRLRLAPGHRVEVIAPGEFDHSLALAGAGTAEAPVEVRFAPGRYDLDPEHAFRRAYQISNTNADPGGRKAVGVLFDHAKHFRLSGPGASLVCRGKMIEVCIDHGEAITVEDLEFDYHRPTVSEFRVAEVGGDFIDIEIHEDSAHTLEDGAIVWRGEGWSHRGGLAQELDPATDRVRRRVNLLSKLEFEEIRPFLLRGRGEHGLKEGWIYQIRDPFRDYCGAFTRRSRDITWRDVTFRFMHGMGLVSQFSENLTFERVTIAPDEAGGRTTAAWADGIQVSGCRGKVLVKDCVFRGTHDDAINIHGTHLRVVGRTPGARQVRVRFMHDQTYGFRAFNPGDGVKFVHADSLAVYASNRVAEVRETGPKEMLLTLEDPLPAAFRENDVLENVTWTPEVEIRGCRVSRIPTRGFLITTRRAVRVEDNDFHATHMPAILIENDAAGWFESGGVRDMLIRGNRFHRCGEPVVHVNPRNSVPNASVHENIRVVENTFHLRGTTAVAAKSTSGLRVIDNVIHFPRAPGEGWMKTRNCEDVVAEGNQLIGAE